MNNEVRFLLGVPVILLIPFILAWVVFLVAAAAVAPADRRGTFTLITLFFGPLGLIAAAVAQPRTPLYVQLATREPAPGRVRVVCARCGAESDLPEGSTTFECWRCPERSEMKTTPSKKRAPTPPTATPTTMTSLRDVMSGDIDDVPRKLRELRQQWGQRGTSPPSGYVGDMDDPPNA
jgi:DNA-directed RNA polymerase subunit RPC12/RpoP